ncbi:MAG: DNA ligase [Povalibacter sp.]
MRTHAAWIALFPVCLTCVAQAEPPSLMLANDYHAVATDLSKYWVSEKYDGIRALWTGTQLLTRAGNPIAVPRWFTENWPSSPMDGELWIARGTFETLSATVRDALPDQVAWRRVQFMVFDLPAHAGPFDVRLQALNALLTHSQGTSLRLVKQWQVTSESQLLSELDTIVADGAEGLMLHRSDSYYHGERSNDLLKLKPQQDDEARVIG